MTDWFEREQLHEAAAQGDLAKVKELAEKGADINAFDEDLSRTPLHYAVIAGHRDVAAYLLSVGADVNAHEEAKIGETPLGTVQLRAHTRWPSFSLTLVRTQLFLDGWDVHRWIAHRRERSRRGSVSIHCSVKPLR